MDWLQNSDTRKWLVPGMGVKRWFLLLFLGMALLGLGVSYLAREAYLAWTLPGAFYYVTLQFIPQVERGALFVVVSVLFVVVGVWKFNAGLLAAVRGRTGNGNGHERLVNLVYRHRFAGRGPRVVALGGGTGLSVLLRGMKEYTDNLTAVVTVADDGGSSGRLRRDLGVIPLGDLRNCIAALADAEPLMTRLFQYRFAERSGPGLEGHSFGNLFIVAMSEVTGSMEEAIHETGRVLAVRGEILPSTLEDVRLVARSKDGRTIRGEVGDHGGGGGDRHRGTGAAPAAGPPRGRERDPQCRPDRGRTGQPLHQRDAKLAGAEHPHCLQRVEGNEDLREQRGHAARRDGSFHRGGITCGPLRSMSVGRRSISSSRTPIWRRGCRRAGSRSPVRLAADPAQALSHGRLVASDVVDVKNRYRHDPEKLAAVILTLYHEQGEAAPRVREATEILAPS